VSGLLAMPAGAAFVVGRPVETLDAGAGYALASMDFDARKQSMFEGIAAQVKLALLPPDSTSAFAGAQPLDPPPGASRLAYVGTDSGIVAFAEMRGIDGKPAAVAELRNADERIRRSTNAAIFSSILSALFAIVIGISLGLLLTRIIRRPVEQLVDHVKTQGYLAVEGAPYTADSTLDDPTLPTEFRELGAVVEDLLRHLSTRQSDLKVAIAKAEYAEESLGIVVSESREAKVVLQDGRIVVVNPAAQVAFGMPPAQLMERTLSEALTDTTVVDEIDVELDPVTLLERALEQSTTARLSRQGQTPRWYVFQAARHADDLHNRILITAQDVTEERRLQQIRSEIVSIISHDLRSPLAVVIGYLDLLRKPLPDEEREKAISSAKRNAGRMADLLEDLLSATRAEELLAPSALMPIALAELAEDVVASIAPTHSERELKVDALCRPMVRGDEKRLRQVLVNLITNAFKYAPDDRPVTVRISCVGESTQLMVVDHGPGVPTEDRDRIFDRYTRLDGASGRPGIGLGLYIVRVISENHGGSVRVEDTEGGGATFVVDLPYTDRVVDPGGDAQSEPTG
jgi:signal transduction histidine kinase